MTAYLTPEAAEALRKALEEELESAFDAVLSDPLTGSAGGYKRGIQAALDIVATLPVVDAVPAEEALTSLLFDQENMTAEDVARAEVAVRHALRAAQAQADAPPPPYVIRRGHEALEDLERVVHAFPDDSRRSRIRSRVAEARAAMHPLPKEE